MKDAVWFSRHRPTSEQVAEAQARGLRIVNVEEGLKLGLRELQVEPDVWAVAEYLRDKVVIGVFPAPLRALWLAVPSQAPIEAWEAWNVARTPEGGKPTFAHREWVRTWVQK